jgi:DNA polymerase alpha subunit B
MSETTVHLESSRMLGSGSRVLLKFEPDMVVKGAPPGAQGFGFFPGELVGIKGRNGGGKLLAVKEILMVSQGGGAVASNDWPS